jgi:hypothetical protein
LSTRSEQPPSRAVRSSRDRRPDDRLRPALRPLDQRERELAELRSRTNTLIAAAALIASFLGAATIRENNGAGALSILALVVLVVAGGLSLYVLWPRELRFAIDARATYEDLYPLLDDPAEAQLRVAGLATVTPTTRSRSTSSSLPSKPPCSCSACKPSYGRLPSR